MARAFSRENEDRLRQPHADGINRNEFARQVAWSVGTITNHATRLGVRSAVRTATEARQAEGHSPLQARSISWPTTVGAAGWLAAGLAVAGLLSLILLSP